MTNKQAERRHDIASNYLFDQTDEGWQKLVVAVLSEDTPTRMFLQSLYRTLYTAYNYPEEDYEIYTHLESLRFLLVSLGAHPSAIEDEVEKEFSDA